jgi:hypothetical protein
MLVEQNEKIEKQNAFLFEQLTEFLKWKKLITPSVRKNKTPDKEKKPTWDAVTLPWRTDNESDPVQKEWDRLETELDKIMKWVRKRGWWTTNWSGVQNNTNIDM